MRADQLLERAVLEHGNDLLGFAPDDLRLVLIGQLRRDVEDLDDLASDLCKAVVDVRDAMGKVRKLAIQMPSFIGCADLLDALIELETEVRHAVRLTGGES